MQSSNHSDGQTILAAHQNDLRTDVITAQAGTVNIKDPAYGAIGDGVANDYAAIQAAYDAVAITGGRLVYPPGSYKVLTSPVLTTSKRVLVTGYGAEIIPAGAIWGFVIRDSGSSTTPVTIEGLTVNCEPAATASALGGFLNEHGSHIAFQDCNFMGDAIGGSGSFVAAICIQNKTAGDAATSSYWTRIDNFRVRNLSSPTKMTAGILIRDDSNATVVSGGLVAHCTDGILLTNRSGTWGLNGVLINEIDLEDLTTGIAIDGDGQGGGTGVRIVNVRAENQTTFFAVRNRTADFSSSGSLNAAPFLVGNFVIPITNYCVKPSGVTVVSMDQPVGLTDTTVAVLYRSPGHAVNVYPVSWTPGAIGAGTSAEQTVTVLGVATNDAVFVTPPSALANGTGILESRVSAADTVAVKFINLTGGPVTPPSGTYRFVATRM